MANAQESITANSYGNLYTGYMPSGRGAESDVNKNTSKESPKKKASERKTTPIKAKEKSQKKDQFQKDLEEKEKELKKAKEEGRAEKLSFEEAHVAVETVAAVQDEKHVDLNEQDAAEFRNILIT